MDHENKEKLRMSRIKLTACVNHFIQISFPGSNFCYMDLVQPCNYQISFESIISNEFNQFQPIKRLSIA